MSSSWSIDSLAASKDYEKQKPSTRNPTQGRVTDSQLKKTLRTNRASISSLRLMRRVGGNTTGSQSNSNRVDNATVANNAAATAALILEQITPWSTLMQGCSPVKGKSGGSCAVSGSTVVTSPSSVDTL